MEWKHPYEDLALFRTISNAYYKRNLQHIEKQKKDKAAEQSKNQGFFSRMFSSGPAVKVESLQITPNLLQELQDSITKSDVNQASNPSAQSNNLPEEVSTIKKPPLLPPFYFIEIYSS